MTTTSHQIKRTQTALFQFTRYVFIGASFIALLPLSAVAQSGPALVRVYDTKSGTVYGEVLTEEDTRLEILELKSAKKMTFLKSGLADLRYGITEREVVSNIGLSPFLVWKVRKAIPSNDLVGKVANLEDGNIYITLGTQAGIEKGQELLVFRESKAIKDPDTGMLLGVQKQRIARLTVVEAMEKLARTRIADDLDVKVAVGDNVEPSGQSKAIAILPFVDLNGAVRAGGQKLSEDLTTGLTQGGISIVERTLLDKVLNELGLQNGPGFDAEKVQKVGKHVGAYAVLTGTMNASANGSEANLRLTRVATGEILFATKQSGPALGGIVASYPVTGLAQPNTTIGALAATSSGSNPSTSTATGWISLFNGEDLSGWTQLNPTIGRWKVEDGAIVGYGFGPGRKNNLYTTQKFWNFVFRCEFMISKDSNSGIYLRGRHEIQVADDFKDKPDRYPTGAIWSGPAGGSMPSEFAARRAGEWQTIEITLLEHRVTVVLNGKKIYDNVECKAMFGALDDKINFPGPILLQGNVGGVRFRNLLIKEIK